MQTLTDKRLAKIKAKNEQTEPVKKTKKSKKSTAPAETSKEV